MFWFVFALIFFSQAALQISTEEQAAERGQEAVWGTSLTSFLISITNDYSRRLPRACSACLFAYVSREAVLVVEDCLPLSVIICVLAVILSCALTRGQTCDMHVRTDAQACNMFSQVLCTSQLQRCSFYPAKASMSVTIILEYANSHCQQPTKGVQFRHDQVELFFFPFHFIGGSHWQQPRQAIVSVPFSTCLSLLFPPLSLLRTARQPCLPEQKHSEMQLPWHLICLAAQHPLQLLVVMGASPWKQRKGSKHWEE